ncbi:methyl-accepting chemotaxis protein [Silvimonas soli]|uniref:methyl-accepting chemotaxis protein n=1 Tax=Silvimonas soli TaxID=2980100 RepID=UPI0024B38872|nr:methyl-accepting chemotaxis protein [Silvimonas soli]
MNISTRIASLLALAVIGLVVLAACAFVSFSRLTGNLQDIADNTLPSEATIAAIQLNISRTKLAVEELLRQDGGQQAQDAHVTELRTQVAALFKKYNDSMISDEKDKGMLEANLALFNRWLGGVDQYMALAKGGQADKARQLLTEQVLPLDKQLDDGLDAWTKYNDGLGEQAKQAAYSTISASRITLIMVSLVTILAVLGIGIWLYRGITGPVSSLRTLLQDISQSLDFTKRSPATSKDEIGQTVTAVNHLLETVERSMQQILFATGEVSTMASTMSGTANEVATSSRRQSDAASNMAAAVEEVTVSINHVADQARQAANASSRSGELASEGERVIGQTTSDIREVQRTIETVATKVEEVEGSSLQVDSVLKVIKDVAEQTNLLALNAAIEAARAGDAGRGFAVVADEVRKLAERTASSTVEIGKIIQQMKDTSLDANKQMSGAVEVARSAVGRAAQAESSIATIRESSSVAVDLVGQITNAIAEQSTASNVIANQVESVAQMTEQNSEAAQSTARSADELKLIVARLTAEIGRYRLVPA